MAVEGVDGDARWHGCRYMPNVKAPEYYAVTGETVPSMPSLDEKQFMLELRRPSEKPPKNINGTDDASLMPISTDAKQPPQQQSPLHQFPET